MTHNQKEREKHRYMAHHFGNDPKTLLHSNGENRIFMGDEVSTTSTDEGPASRQRILCTRTNE